jgi:hypothetical protein
MFIFESLFAPEVAQKHVMAPLPWAREQFLIHLAQRGTGRTTLRVYAASLNQIVRFLKLKRYQRNPHGGRNSGCTRRYGAEDSVRRPCPRPIC